MLEELPSELLVHVVRMADLGWRELAALSRVSRALYRVCTEPELRRRALRGQALCVTPASASAAPQRRRVLAREEPKLGAEGGVHTSEEVARLTVVSIACGPHHCLVMDGSGEVYALGDQDDNEDDGIAGHQRADAWPPLLSRVVLSPGVRITSVSAGFNHSLALSDTGHMYAWGSNDNGQLGVGRWSDQLPHWPTPLQVKIDAVVSIAAGKLFSLAVTREGVLFEWGLSPRTITRSRLPRSVIGISKGTAAAATVAEAAAVAAGQRHALVLTNDGRVLWYGPTLTEWKAGGGSAERAAAVAIAAGHSFGVFLTSKGDVMLLLRDATMHKLHDAKFLGERAVEIAAGGDQALFRTDRGRLFSVHHGPNPAAASTATVTATVRYLPAPFTLRLDTGTLHGLPSESLRGLSVGPKGCFYLF